MRSIILSGPVGGLRGMLALGSASGPRVEECSEYVLACAGLGSGAFSGAAFLSAATAVLVCTHLRYGLECMTILRFFLGRCASPSEALLAASSCSLSRWCSSAAIRRPSALPCDQPPYVRGGS
jgi:hypothetical protein